MSEFPRVARNIAGSLAALSVSLFWPQTLRAVGVLGPHTYWRHGEAFHETTEASTD